ncbi:MAG: hypothetical protein J1F35_08930 [Erysipelotrichales bacterium]|nr:hypothetical protein [Erysipelotrichales bacterium]
MIPPFDHNHVIPPHLGNPADPTQISPYLCEISEFCQHFCFSKERINILIGFVSFRLKMIQNGIVNGFQWVDGSFTENVEARENRPPHDLDVVTFFKGIDLQQSSKINSTFQEFSNPHLSKQKFFIDHYPFPFDANPDFTVEYTRYWYQLFSHNRRGVWKGIIKIPLYVDPVKDTDALTFLKNINHGLPSK